jgi:hypothetical protein
VDLRLLSIAVKYFKSGPFWQQMSRCPLLVEARVLSLEAIPLIKGNGVASANATNKEHRNS